MSKHLFCSEKERKLSQLNMQRFILEYNGVINAAKALQCAPATLYQAAHGYSLVSPRIARDIEVLTKGRYVIEELMPWLFSHRKRNKSESKDEKPKLNPNKNSE